MTQRTCNLIMCCKGNDRFGYLGSPLYSIKMYMAKECGASVNDYKDHIIEDILYDALMDYIDGVKKPSFVLWSIKNEPICPKNNLDRLIKMFSLVQVRNSDGYVNGFTEEQIKQSKIDLK